MRQKARCNKANYIHRFNMTEMLKALGGLKTMKTETASTQEWAQQILSDIPARAVWAFKGNLRLNNDEFGGGQRKTWIGLRCGNPPDFHRT